MFRQWERDTVSAESHIFTKVKMHPYKDKKSNSARRNKIVPMEVLTDDDEDIDALDESFACMRSEIEELWPKTYNYPATSDLTDIDEDNIEDDATVHICAYQLNVAVQIPFLEFLLHNASDTLSWPSFKAGFARNACSTIIEFIERTLNVIFTCYPNTGRHQYMGALSNNKRYYFFYDFSEYKIGTQMLYRTNDLWLATLDDIVNKRMVCGLTVDDSVVVFFLKNPQFIALHDCLGKTVETPLVVYTSAFGNMVDMKGMFGEPRRFIDGLGSWHFFTSYENAVEEASQKSGRSGILRTAIFLTLEDDKNQKENIFVADNDTPLWGVSNLGKTVTLSYHYLSEGAKGTIQQIVIL